MAKINYQISMEMQTCDYNQLPALADAIKARLVGIESTDVDTININVRIVEFRMPSDETLAQSIADKVNPKVTSPKIEGGI